VRIANVSDGATLAVDGLHISSGLAHSDRRNDLLLRCRKWRGALSAEFEARRVLEATLGADQREWRGALSAKFHPTRVFEPALRAAHRVPPRAKQATDRLCITQHWPPTTGLRKGAAAMPPLCSVKQEVIVV
jgi:hypothetical protein